MSIYIYQIRKYHKLVEAWEKFDNGELVRVKYDENYWNPVCKWLKENCQNDVQISGTHIYFTNEMDAIMFELGFKK